MSMGKGDRAPRSPYSESFHGRPRGPGESEDPFRKKLLRNQLIGQELDVKSLPVGVTVQVRGRILTLGRRAKHPSSGAGRVAYPQTGTGRYFLPDAWEVKILKIADKPLDDAELERRRRSRGSGPGESALGRSRVSGGQPVSGESEDLGPPEIVYDQDRDGISFVDDPDDMLTDNIYVEIEATKRHSIGVREELVEEG